MDRMSSDQRIGYLAGTVEMAAFLSGLAGNADRADCLTSWFYEQDGTETIVAALSQYRDRQALPVLHLLMNRACGE